MFWQGNKPDEQVGLNALALIALRLTANGERKWEESMPVASRLAEEIFTALTDEELRELQARTEKLRTVEPIISSLVQPLSFSDARFQT